MAAETSSPSSLLPSSESWKFDVFLSFRGYDTRKTFVGHLYNALQQKGLSTFKDNEELKKGDVLGVLVKAIEVSKVSVVVFSPNFAHSRWCLRELVKILECMDKKQQMVVPIFYQVEPADVRYVKKTFADDFAIHENNSKLSTEDLQRWRAALTRAGDIIGWESSKYEDDAGLIDDVVKDVFLKVINTRSSKPSDLVGMDSHIDEMRFLLRPGLNDVRIVGIWGMGGIGKTTIARVVYDEMRWEFKHHCFLYNVKEDFKRKGEVQVQEDLLFRILNERVRNLGSDMIMEMLGEIKLFLVLDDVDSSRQIDALLGKQRSFGGGSRIIITTRDRSLLREFDIYEPKYLDNDEALELFNKHAFRTTQSSEEFEHLSKHAIKYAQGLPLALTVLGASLHMKSIQEWKVEFEKLKRRQHMGIEAVLRTSFEGLEDLQKKIFLDIACFFRGMEKDYATEILDACGFFPESELPVLVDRALVTYSGYYSEVLAMHDLLVNMSLGIIHREPNLSRLSISDGIEEALTPNMDTNALESIDLNLCHSKVVNISAEAFVHMTKLRLLRIHINRSIESVDDYQSSLNELYPLSEDCKQHIIGDFKFLSHELRCLIWHGCPLNSLPSNFLPKNLVDLDMRCSHIKLLWEGKKPLKKLKFIDISLSPYLIEIPDLTEAKNLERINLEGCTSLLEVHSSISDLENLVFLNLKGCKELKVLPSSICLKSLKGLELSGCSNLENFPEISGVMEELPRLFLDKTEIKELPGSIENLRGLVTLSLKDCRELKSLPSSICQLKSLRYLILSGCSKFKVFPKIVGKKDMKELKELHMDGTSIKEFLPSISALNKLSLLSLRNCKELKNLPSSIGMESLESLVLSGCSNLEKFPEILGTKYHLSELDLDDIAIEELPPSIKNLEVLKSLSLRDCGEIKSLPSSIFQLKLLENITISGCSKFELFPKDSSSAPKKLVTLRIEDCREFRSLPSSFCQLHSLRFVTLSGCSKFEVFPEILEDMEELRELHLDGTSIKEIFPSIERLRRLMLLNMSNCRSLFCLPDNICNLSYLRGLTLSGCLNLYSLPENLGNLESLLDLEVEGSGIIQDVHLNKSLSTKCLVAIDRHINEIKFLLCPEQVDDISIVGICGTGGIGKTTIAMAVYDEMAPQFEYHCFLENVKEGFAKEGAVYMQEELLSRILKENVQSSGILDISYTMKMKRLGMKEVLLVLDDVDDIIQIETLIGKPISFGSGSRIIVTTRDEEILSGTKIYRPKLLDDEALELFRHYAFRKIKPSKEFDQLSRRAIEYAQGLPLDLKVWGSFLFNKSVKEWKYALKDKRTVYWVLTTGFYALHYTERNILLDVAWLFRGMKEEYATKILHRCGLFPYSALRVLIDRSFISVSDRDGTLKTHDLVHGIVRDCIRHEDEHAPEDRSRLEGFQGIRCLSTPNLVTEEVEVITVDLSKSKEVCLYAEAFVTMKKLRLLQIHDNGSMDRRQHVNGDFEFISHELRSLIWRRCPLKSFPSNFYPKNLVNLDMRFSHLEQLWEGTKPLKNLTFVDLSHSQYLEKIPDLTEATNLEKLILEGCTTLFDVHPSIFHLENLVFLSLKGCRELKILPSSIHMKSLKTLDLSGCSKFKKFPEISEVMMGLSEINLDETAIEELPSSIERLQGLSVLSMRNCRSLVSLPESICNLVRLTFLILPGCSKLSSFPESLRNVQSLTISGIEQVPIIVVDEDAEIEGVSQCSSESGEGSNRTEEKEKYGEGGGILRALCNFFSCLLDLCR